MSWSFVRIFMARMSVRAMVPNELRLPCQPNSSADIGCRRAAFRERRKTLLQQLRATMFCFLTYRSRVDYNACKLGGKKTVSLALATLAGVAARTSCRASAMLIAPVSPTAQQVPSRCRRARDPRSSTWPVTRSPSCTCTPADWQKTAQRPSAASTAKTPRDLSTVMTTALFMVDTLMASPSNCCRTLSKEVTTMRTANLPLDLWRVV